jgi:hemolysin III
MAAPYADPVGRWPFSAGCGIILSMQDGERFNSITHLIGACLAVPGLTLLVVQAARLGDPWKVVSFSVYGASLVALFSFSTLYHSLRGNAKKILQAFDHSAIYLLIAGTYTPFMLVTLRGPWGWTIISIVWTLAIAGILQEVLFKKRRTILSVSLYLIMGWLIVVALRPLSRALPEPGMHLLVAGGLCYTVGVVFYALGRRIPHGHGIFHLFVLAGSACHYLSILFYVA